MAECLQCGEGTEYDIVQLLAVLNINEGSTQTIHGQMTAVIRYHTPFLVNKQDPLILSYALGKDGALRSVLALPSLLVMSATLNLPLGKLVCSEFNFTFPLLLDPPGKGLPDGVSFPDSKLSIPRGIPSNQNALIQYTAMGDILHLLLAK